MVDRRREKSLRPVQDLAGIAMSQPQPQPHPRSYPRQQLQQHQRQRQDQDQYPKKTSAAAAIKRRPFWTFPFHPYAGDPKTLRQKDAMVDETSIQSGQQSTGSMDDDGPSDEESRPSSLFRVRDRDRRRRTRTRTRRRRLSHNREDGHLETSSASASTGSTSNAIGNGNGNNTGNHSPFNVRLVSFSELSPEQRFTGNEFILLQGNNNDTVSKFPQDHSLFASLESPRHNRTHTPFTRINTDSHAHAHTHTLTQMQMEMYDNTIANPNTNTHTHSPKVARQLAREKRRRELIAQYLYADTATQHHHHHHEQQQYQQQQQEYKKSLYNEDSGVNHNVHGDGDGDDGIVDLNNDDEADGVARRRYCFPSFARPRLFGNKACTQPTASTSTGTGTSQLSDHDDEVDEDDPEEAYDYDYYFTISENLACQDSRRNNDLEATPITTTRVHDRFPLNVLRQVSNFNSNSSQSSDESPTAIDPTFAMGCTGTGSRLDPPADSYCFFPVDDHSTDDQEDQQLQDLPLCNWNDVQYYSSACASQIVTPKTAQRLQATCHANAQLFQIKYHDLAQSATNECSAITPRDALEDIVPPDLLFLFTNSCVVGGGGGVGGRTRSTHSCCYNDDDDTTKMAATQDEFQY